MKIDIVKGLPYALVRIEKGSKSEVCSFLIDTGSYSTIVSAQVIERLGLKPESSDEIRQIRGVGGSEFVYRKEVDKLTIGDITLSNYKVDVGEMDYGYEIVGILGMDVLTSLKCVIDLGRLELQAA